MSRVPLSDAFYSSTNPWRSARRKTVYVYQRGTETQATLYAAEEGGSTLSQPLITDGEGRAESGGVMPWVEAGSYDLKVGSQTLRWEAVNSIDFAVTKETPLNVMYPEYGAVGNGVTDDSTAIQKALNAAKDAGGGEVLVPNRTFLCNSTLVIDNKTTLRGVNSHASTLKLGTNKKTAILQTARFEVGGASSGAEYIHLHDIGFDANAANNVGSTASLVALDAKAPKVENIFCKGGYVNLYSVMKRPELEGGNIPEHGVFYGLELAESTGYGLYLEGPHDSEVVQATIRTLDGIGAYCHGTATHISKTHVYGHSTYGFHLGGGHIASECISEGNTVGAVGLFGDSNQWRGGWIFSAGGEDAGKGFVFGDGTHTASSTHIEGVHMEGCVNGAFIFERSGEGSRISGQVFASTGELVKGAPSRRIWWDLVLRGGQTWGVAPSSVQELAAANTLTLTEVRAGGVNSFKLSGGTEVKKINALPQGTTLVLKIADTTKVIDGENLHLEGNSEGAAGRTLTLVSDGAEWWESARRAT